MEYVGRLALIALGSNENSTWGDATETVKKALTSLQDIAHSPIKCSHLYKTPAFPADSGPDFVNAAAAFVTPMTAKDIMHALHGIEADAGRKRADRWTQRTLDLDLIGLGDLVCPDAKTHEQWRNLSLERQMQDTPDRLILPHPRLQDRSFVLVPLADIAADWTHPLLGKTVQQMLAGCATEDIASVVRLC